MRVYNYASFAKVFEQGAVKPNMTNIAKILFEPIIDLGQCINAKGNPYHVDTKAALLWYKQEKDIPSSLKEAANKKAVYYGIGQYFDDKVLGKFLSDIKVEGMLKNLIELIKDSDLSDIEKSDLERIYDNGDWGEFLGKAFLSAVLRDNTQKELLQNDSTPNETSIADDIEAFKRVISNMRSRKPNPLSPPPVVAEEEMRYVKELYQVYQERTGMKCSCQEDLDSMPKMKKNFNRQRKDYYKAETIRRGLRDTVSLQENECFDIAKEEVYEGVVSTEEKDYDSGFDRMSAVMEHATLVQLSPNLNLMTLDWIGPGEKKGICHMLVNDKLLSWMGDD